MSLKRWRGPRFLAGIVLATGALLLVPQLVGAGLLHGRRSACAPVYPPPCAPPPQAAPEAADRAAILQVLTDQAAAWNKGDLDGFMSGYWNSPDLSFFSGAAKTRGWRATLERYQQRYRAEGKEMGRLTFREVEVDLLGPDSALVRGRWQLKMSKEEPGGLYTLIFRRFPEGWRIVHDHTSS